MKDSLELLAYRRGIKAALLFAWEVQHGDHLSVEVGGDERGVDEWLDAVDAGDFDMLADMQGLPAA